MITATTTESSNLKADLNLGYIWLISSVAALGGLLFGWDWVVIGGAKPFFQRYFQLTTEAQIGWANSCALIGCLVGALMAGGLSDKFGRKRLLIFSAFLFAVTSLGNALAGNFSIFIDIDSSKIIYYIDRTSTSSGVQSRAHSDIRQSNRWFD